MNKERGSEKMLRQRMEQPMQMSPDVMAKFVDILVRDDIYVDRWWWKGQPVIDVFAGSIVIRRESLGEVINSMIDVGVQVEFKVFPKGIINPEEFLVSFRSGL
jgi:hypothetical protein